MSLNHNLSGLHFPTQVKKGIGLNNLWNSLQVWRSMIYAAAAAKSLQSCPTLCNPTDGSPPGSPVPGILQARTLEQVAISFSNAWKWKVKVKSLSRVWHLVTPWTATYQAPPSMGFFQARILEWGAIAFSFHDLWNALKAKSHNCGIATAMLTLLYLPPFTLITISHYLFPMAHLYKFLCLTAAYLIRVTPIILRKK